MGKQPYIPFYIGDYIKDTRKLPLFVRGAWVDLLLFMWEEDPRGEITMTIDEFSGLLGCTSQEAAQAIAYLIEKKVCDSEKVGEQGKMRIVSRRMKRDIAKSIKLSESGKKGAEIKKSLSPPLQKKEAHPKAYPQGSPSAFSEYENEYDNDNEYKNDIASNFGKSENLLNGATSLIAQMQDIWVNTFPHYSSDKSMDYPACKKIADFIFNQSGVTHGFGDTNHEITALNTFQLIADQVNREQWWVNKPLSMISNNIQKFYNEIKNPNVSAEKKSSAATRASVNEAINKKFAGKGHVQGK